MKTSELTRLALNWAVDEIENPKPEFYRDNEGLEWEREYKPSTDWAQGGPIIEREAIQLTPDEYTGTWAAYMTNGGEPYEGTGKTPLIAAMRCYVASKMGDEIEIPTELGETK